MILLSGHDLPAEDLKIKITLKSLKHLKSRKEVTFKLPREKAWRLVV